MVLDVSYRLPSSSLQSPCILILVVPGDYLNPARLQSLHANSLTHESYLSESMLTPKLSSLWILVLLFLPETKALTLEELDQVFSVPTWKHSSYQLKKVGWSVRRYILRQDIEPMAPFWQGRHVLKKLTPY